MSPVKHKTQGPMGYALIAVALGNKKLVSQYLAMEVLVSQSRYHGLGWAAGNDSSQ